MTRRRGRPAIIWVLAGLTAAWCAAQLVHLPHGRLRHWDEVYHFKVATALLDDPLVPRLRVAPLRPVSQLDWWDSEVWLHKPPLPFWVSALAMKLLGREVFSFRLPSVLLGALCIALTFWLGRRAKGPAVGLGAAGLFAANAFASDVVQGIQFGDITDIHLAAWNTAAVALLVYAVETGKPGAWALSGAAAGLAVLSKLFLGLTPLGLGLLAFWLRRRQRLDSPPVGGTQVAIQWAAAALVAMPALLYLRARFPAQFDHEIGYALHHFGGALDPRWVHGPDWTWNSMLQRELRPPLALFGAVAIVAFSVRMGRSRTPAAALAAAWLAISITAVTVARMKAPAQLFGAFPALCIALAWWVDDAIRRPSAWSAGLALGIVVQCITWPWKVAAPWTKAPAAALRALLPDVAESPEILRGVVFVLAGTGVVFALLLLARRSGVAPLRALLRLPAEALAIAVAVASLAFSVEALRDIRQHWWRSWSREAARAIVLHGPQRAAIFVDGISTDDRLDLELEAFTGQPAVPTPRGPGLADLEAAARQGRRPLLVTVRVLPFAALKQEAPEKRFEVYELERPGPGDPLASFGVHRDPAMDPRDPLLGVDLETRRVTRGGTFWLASCWRLDRPPATAMLHLLGSAGSSFRAAQPIAYGLLDGQLRAGDVFCQRDLVDVPPDAARGETDLWLSVGDDRAMPSYVRLQVD